MAVKIQVEVCWLKTPCNVAAKYQCFGGPCYLLSSEMLVSYCNIMWHHNPKDLDLLKYKVKGVTVFLYLQVLLLNYTVLQFHC
jgi:hypothetical protein